MSKRGLINKYTDIRTQGWDEKGEIVYHTTHQLSGQTTCSALPFLLPPLLAFSFKEEKENKDFRSLQIWVLICCYFSGPLKHKPFQPLTPPTRLFFCLTTKPEFDMQVFPEPPPLSQTISDCSGGSVQLSACCNFLASYIIHVCLCVRARRVKRLRLPLMRVTKQTERKTCQQSQQQQCHQYHWEPVLTSNLQQNMFRRET